MSRRRAQQTRVGREAVLGFRDAHGVVPVSGLFELFELIADLVVGADLLGAVDIARNPLGLLPQRQVIRIQSAELGAARIAKCHDLSRQILGAGAAIGPVRAVQRFDAEFAAIRFQCLRLGVGIRCEAIDADQHRHAKASQVADMAAQIFAAGLQRGDVLFAELVFGDSAVHLQGLDGRHEHHGIGLEIRFAAFDVEELLGAEVSAEARLGHHEVGKLERGARRNERIAAVRDVGERPAVHERGAVLDGLHEVRLQRIAQQRGHRARGAEFPHRHGLLPASVAEHDVANALLKISQVAGQAEDRHDLRGHRNIEARLAHYTVVVAAQPGRDAAQSAIVHVEHAPPRHPPRIDIECIVPVHVVIDQGGQQVMRRADGVEITGEVQIDVRHWHDLGVAPAGRSAFHAEAGAEAGFAQADRRLSSDAV